MFNKSMIRERKAVAPIIATLLMVAIAVVGGILVFVFANTFFTQTSDIQGGQIDSIAITGYDAKSLASSETIDIYITNKSTHNVTLDRIEIDGNKITNNTEIQGGERVTISIDYPNDLVNGRFIKVEAFTINDASSSIAVRVGIRDT